MPLRYLRLHQAVHKVMAAKKQQKKHKKYEEIVQLVNSEQSDILAVTQGDTAELKLGNQCGNSVSISFPGENVQTGFPSTYLSDDTASAYSFLPPLTLQSDQESASLQVSFLTELAVGDLSQSNSGPHKGILPQLPPIHELNLSVPLTDTTSSPIPIPVSHPSHAYYNQEELPPLKKSPCSENALVFSSWSTAIEVEPNFCVSVRPARSPPLQPVLSDDGTDIELEHILKNSYGPDADRMAESLKFLAATLKSQGNTLMERLVDSPDQPQSHHYHLHNDILFGKIPTHGLQIVNVLGCGSFGIVLRCRLLETNQEVALKIIDKQLIHVSQYTNRGHLAEVAVMQALTDESDSDLGIPRVLEAWEDDFAWYAMMEYGGYPWAILMKGSNNMNVFQKRIKIKMDLIDAAAKTHRISPVTNQMARISLRDFTCSQAVSIQTTPDDWIENIECVQRMVHPNIPQVLTIPLMSVDHHLGALIRVLGGYENVDRSSSTMCRQPVIPLEAQLVILRSVLVALNRLHTNGLCHRDVKCENVLVDRELSRIQLIDYGHAANYRCTETPDAPVFTQYGTHLFSPPEVRWPEYRPSGKQSYKTGRYRGPEADVYALGLMCYEMTFGDLPPELFRVPTYPDAAQGCHMSFWDIGGIRIGPDRGFSNHVHADLVRCMLSVDPRQRPSACQLLEMVDDVSQNMTTAQYTSCCHVASMTPLSQMVY